MKNAILDVLEQSGSLTTNQILLNIGEFFDWLYLN